MRTPRPCLWMLLLGFCFPLGSHASRMAWLDVHPDARGAALGGCVVALEEGSDSVAGNPAWLGSLGGTDLALMHNQWFDDTHFEHASAGTPLGQGWGGALLFDYAGLGTVQGLRVGSDGYAYPTRTLDNSGLRLGGGLGKKNGAFSFGAALDGVFVKEADTSRQGLQWRLGGVYQRPASRWALGVRFQGGLGEVAEGSKTSFRPGASYLLGKAEKSSVRVLGEGDLGGDQPSTSARFGLEYAYTGRYFLRCGYHLYNDDSQLGGSRGLTAGAGWRSARFALDYAFTSVGELGNAHQMTARFLFPGTRSDATPSHPKGKGSKSPKAKDKNAQGNENGRKEATQAEEPKGSADGSMMSEYQTGMAAYKEKRYAAAIKHLRKAVALEDSSVKDFYYAEAYATLGAIYHHHRSTDGHTDQARQYYLQALEKDADTETAKKGLKDLEGR